MLRFFLVVLALSMTKIGDFRKGPQIKDDLKKEDNPMNKDKLISMEDAGNNRQPQMLCYDVLKNSPYQRWTPYSVDTVGGGAPKAHTRQQLWSGMRP